MTGDRSTAADLTEVLADVAGVVGSQVVLLDRLPGGFQGGAMRVELAGGTVAVLKALPWAHPNHLEGARRARRVVEHMRSRGYPTPAWLGVGATASHVWELVEFVDGAPVPELTPVLVQQLIEIVELQAGQATEREWDHWAYTWRVATGQEPATAHLPAYSVDVAALVDRIRRLCAGAAHPPESPDMVHADLSIGNVLVRDGAVVAVVDIGAAGSGTRAIDLTTLQWYTFSHALTEARDLLRAKIVELVGWEGAAVLLSNHILHMLEFPIRHGRHDVVPGVIVQGHQALDELQALR